MIQTFTEYSSLENKYLNYKNIVSKESYNILLDDDNFLLLECLTQELIDYYCKYIPNWRDISNNNFNIKKFKKSYIIVDKTKLSNTNDFESVIFLNFEYEMCVDVIKDNCWYIFNQKKFRNIKDIINFSQNVLKINGCLFYYAVNYNGMSFKKIDRILNSLYLFKNVTHLDISRNKIQDLTSKIGKMANLKTLSAQSNDLVEIPIEIGNLKNLEHLYLNDNKLLTFIPTEIGLCKNITNIGLVNCPIEFLPKEIVNLKNLKSLDLYGTKIKYKDIPIEMKSLKGIKIITSDYNSNE